MPTIPRASFDTVPSSRVDQVRAAPVQNPTAGLSEAASGLAGAFAKLQDQSERTEAFSKANEVKKRYLNEKIQYEAALESSDANGNYSYIDPTDNTPDVTKRRRMTGNMSERFMALKDTYDKGIEEVSGITRADIGNELLDQYVGDDLIQTQLKANRVMIRKKETEVTESLMENMELKLNSVMDAFSAGTTSPEMTSLKVAQLGNSIDRELAAAAPIIGSENTARMAKLRDRSYATTAKEIIRNTMNNGSVAAAEIMVSKIRSPMQRQLAEGQLERAKKEAATTVQRTAFTRADGLSQSIRNAPAIDDSEFIKAVETSRQLSNLYINEKYSPITKEQADSASIDLLSTALSKKTIQNHLMDNLDFLDSAAPGERGLASRDALIADIEKELHESGVSTGMSPESIEQLKQQTISKMAQDRANLRNNVADVVASVYKDVQGVDRIEKINAISEAQGLGYGKLATSQDIAAFKRDFTSAIARDPISALEVFEARIAPAGSASTGNRSYRRALAMDLADKDPNMAYIIPMADAQGPQKLRMVQNASQYKQILDDYDITDSQLDEQFLSYGVSKMDGMRGTNVYSGIKQAIYHEAAARFVGNRNLKTSMREAVDQFSNQYMMLRSDDSRTNVVMLNTPSSNYNDSKDYMKAGTESALSMPSLSYTQKAELLERYIPGVGIRSSDGAIKASHSMIDTTLKALVAIEPDPRYPNVHRYTINKAPLLDNNGSVIEVTGDQILKYGEESVSKKKEASFKRMGYK